MLYKITKSQLPSHLKSKSEQIQFNASRYVPTGTKFKFNVWGDATITLKSTDLPGTVTIPSIRLSLA